MKRWKRGCLGCLAAVVALGLGATSAKARADGANGRVVVIVLGRNVFAKEVERPGDLDRLVFAPIFEDFADRHHIEATDAEIDELIATLDATPLPAGVPPLPRTPEMLQIRREIAKSMVRTWKVSRALYRQYGGEVIFQQFNPVEPVGAYRKLLEEREREGALKFLDPKIAEQFWQYYRFQHHPMKNNDQDPFETPWWRKTPP